MQIQRYVLQNGDRMLYNNSGLNAGKILELDEAEESNNKAIYDIKSGIIHQGKTITVSAAKI